MPIMLFWILVFITITAFFANLSYNILNIVLFLLVSDLFALITVLFSGKEEEIKKRNTTLRIRIEAVEKMFNQILERLIPKEEKKKIIEWLNKF